MVVMVLWQRCVVVLLVWCCCCGVVLLWCGAAVVVLLVWWCLLYSTPMQNVWFVYLAQRAELMCTTDAPSSCSSCMYV